MGKNLLQNKKERITTELILLLPLLFLVTVYFFCVRARVVESGYYQTFWYVGGQQIGDLFAYFRMQILVVLTVLFSGYLLFCIWKGKLQVNRHKVYIPMAIYAVLVIASCVLSEYRQIALWGVNGRYEGTIVLLCYMALLFYTMQAVQSEKGVVLLVKGFGAACVLLGIWGIAQVCGMHLSDLPQWLYLPADMRDTAEIFVETEENVVNWFFSNQNYVSFFMVFPVCLFGMACIAAEEWKKKVFFAALTGLMLFCLWQAASLGGMVGLAAAVLAAVLLFGKHIVKWKKSLGLLFLAGVISVGASLPIILREVKSGTQTEVSVPVKKEELRFARIDDIITDGADIVFIFEGEEVRIATENGAVKSVSGAASDLLRTVHFVDAETGYPVVIVETANKDWYFIVQNETAYYLSQTGMCIPLHHVESIGFANHEGFATNRGYIWSRTLPLLKDTLLLGTGADTYALYFPQEDYAGRYNIGSFSNTTDVVVDKPHNMYLGTAVQTGVLSMIALLAIYVLYLVESVKLYRKHTYTGFMDYIGVGILLAVIGYLVAGLANDTTIQMMPAVYIFLGMGFAINRLLRKRTKEQ